MAWSPPPTDEQCLEAYNASLSHKTTQAAARSIGLTATGLKWRIKLASQRGLLGTKPVLRGFEITKTTAVTDQDGNVVREFIQQKPEHGGEFEVPAGHSIKGVSALIDSDGREIIKWVKTNQDAAAREDAMRSVIDAFKEEIPKVEPVTPPTMCNENLLNQYTVTDLHFGMLAWREESGADYDLKIAEKLLLDWFSAAIQQSPNASKAVLCQLGDLLHHDSHLSVTPTHAHVLDADSRLQKMIRVVIRTMRRVVQMLLEKHDHVHIIMADANHDPAGGAWLREMFAAFYEGEPRVTVDSSASTYYAYEFGNTSLFYHHGHKRKINSVDGVFVGKFREIFGRTKFSYAHLGHLHSDELKSAPSTMKVERHETLSAPDAFAANGGWLSGRSAKVITYSRHFGEVGRVTLTPEMVSVVA